MRIGWDIRMDGPACRFTETTGRPAAIGRLGDAAALLDGTAGTIVTP